MSRVIGTYLNKEIEPTYKKCCEIFKTNKPSEVIRQALDQVANGKVTTEQSPEEFVADLQKKDKHTLAQMMKDMKITRNAVKSHGMYHHKNYMTLVHKFLTNKVPIDEAIFLLQQESKSQKIIEVFISKEAML